ncbi:hypothetical protein CRI70_02675 [Streptomyces sp. Ru87]|nr:hypothetical protein CRI70_02675 [Streptomyces sp. Ru87]
MGRFSLRAKLLLLTAGLLLSGLGLTSAVVSDHLERYQVDRIDSQLRSLTALVSRVPATGPPDLGSATGRPELLRPGLDLFGAPYLAYLDTGGAVTGDVHSPRPARPVLPQRDTLRTVPTTGEAVDLPAADGSGRWRAVARPTTGREGTVIAAAPLAEVEATISRLRTSSLVSGASLLVLLTAAGWFALGRGLRPLRRIEHTAAAIAGGDLARRVPELAAPHTEIGHLAASLNTMLGQLEQAFADRAASETRMRTFLWDVSHELRTPLFGIKGTAELYRMGALPERGLVGNAVAHTPPGTPVRIGVGSTGGHAVLEVADGGPGMTAREADRVFDRFYRTDRSRNRSGGAGTGLGLAIARSLARAHHGDIRLDTSPGEGARFRLTLPLPAPDQR